MTSWYEARPLDPQLLPTDHSIAVHSAVKNPIELAGKKVVILGGGLSAYEYATRLLQGGQAVVLLSRSAPRPIFQDRRFCQLVEATGSTVLHRVSDLVFGRSKVQFNHKGRKRTVRCDALVAAIGQRLREDVLQMLAAAGVLSPAECGLLRAARSLERLLQEHPNRGQAWAMRQSAAELPDLKEQLFEGKRGVHLAGAVHHAGAAHGGVVFSTFSAVLAVRALAGHPPPDGAGAPLPEYLPTLPFPEPIPPALAWERISALRPLTASTVLHPPLSAADERLPAQSPRSEEQRPGTLREASEIDRILSAADGTIPVAKLAQGLGVTTATELASFLKLLRHLWRNGRLTWLPAVTRFG